MSCNVRDVAERPPNRISDCYREFHWLLAHGYQFCRRYETHSSLLLVRIDGKVNHHSARSNEHYRRPFIILVASSPELQSRRKGRCEEWQNHDLADACRIQISLWLRSDDIFVEANHWNLTDSRVVMTFETFLWLSDTSACLIYVSSRVALRYLIHSMAFSERVITSKGLSITWHLLIFHLPTE